VIHEFVKPVIEPNPTFRLITQATMGATPWWFGLGLQLNESSHLRVCSKGHIIVPHFRDVNVFIDVTLK
jgi:hypothetical protein